MNKMIDTLTKKDDETQTNFSDTAIVIDSDSEDDGDDHSLRCRRLAKRLRCYETMPSDDDSLSQLSTNTSTRTCPSTPPNSPSGPVVSEWSQIKELLLAD